MTGRTSSFFHQIPVPASWTDIFLKSFVESFFSRKAKSINIIPILTDNVNINAALKVLKETWGYSSFRPLQAEILGHVLERSNTLGVLPTGGGKSLCYQIPALMRDQIVVVISPLISLIEDQVVQLKKLGVRAEYVHSGRSSKTIDRVLDNCIYGNIQILYVSPERLKNRLFQERAAKMNIQLLAVDEAHCISQWGHDFRPAYLNIREFIDFHPQDFPVLALTASATPRVQREIQESLGMPGSILVRGSCLRDNLDIVIAGQEDKIGILKAYVERAQGKIIIYIRNRRQVEMIAGMLSGKEREVSFYHAGIDHTEKQERQQRFSSGEIQIMVATNAFGMGIDIRDIRHVLHFGIPSSLEEYYQEIGRAGRDGRQGYTYMIYNEGDVSGLWDNFRHDFPPPPDLWKFYRKIHVHYQIPSGEGRGKLVHYDLLELSKSLGMGVAQVNGSLKALGSLGLIELQHQSREQFYIRINTDPRELRQMMDVQDNKGTFAEALMRHYEGVFGEWVELNIEDLARHLHVRHDEIRGLLNAFSNRGLISVFRKKPGSILHFVENRTSQNNLPDHLQRYDYLKSVRKERLEALIHFMEADRCRHQILLEYFGESMESLCGHCDHCRKSNLSLDDQEIIQFDQEGLQSLLYVARRDKNTKLLDQLQYLHNEGLINLPI